MSNNSIFGSAEVALDERFCKIEARVTDTETSLEKQISDASIVLESVFTTHGEEIAKGVAELLAGQINAEDVAGHIDLSEVAGNIPTDDVAEEINLGSLAERLDMESLSEHLQDNIDYNELAERLDISKVADKIDLKSLGEHINGDLITKIEGLQNQIDSLIEITKNASVATKIINNIVTLLKEIK